MKPQRTAASKSLRRKSLLSIVLGLTALVVGVVGFAALAALKKPPEAREQTEKTYNVEVFDVEPLDLQEILCSFGTARAEREVTVAAQVSGQIVEIHPGLDVGNQVESADVRIGPSGESQRSAGDLLVRIDPQTYRERVVQAEKRLAQDDAELTKLEQEERNNARVLAKAKEDYQSYQEEFDRVKSLRERGVASPSDLTRAALELRKYEDALIQLENEVELFPLRREQLQTRRDTNRADLELARLDLERTEVRPPFSGTLSEVMVEEGQFVRTGDSLVRLTDLDEVEIPVPLTLTDYAKIEPLLKSGRQPAVELAENETSAGRWFGHLVRAAPEADESTRTIEVFVQVDNTVQKIPLLPGTFVHARIDGPVLEETIVVPRDAITRGRVFVAADGRVEERQIEVRRSLQTLAVVESGVRRGEALILTNLDVIFDGAKVNPQSHRSLADELEQQRIQVARPVLAGAADAGERDLMN